MRAVWKYPLQIQDDQLVRMPRGAKLLCAQNQHSVVMLWALVDPNERSTNRLIVIAGTGHELPDEVILTYVDTVQTHHGDLVWHVFDGGER